MTPDAVGREAADDAEQGLDLAVVEDRGRLVHDQQLDVARERAGDRDDLLRGGAQRAHEHVGRDVAVVEALEQRAVSRPHRARSSSAEPARLVAEEDALGHAQVLDEVELLVDRPDPAAIDSDGSPTGQRLAVDEDLALGRGDHARHALDQRRLAGAVGAEQAVHLARRARRSPRPSSARTPGYCFAIPRTSSSGALSLIPHLPRLRWQARRPSAPRARSAARRR